MKRHRYSLRKHIIVWNTYSELSNASATYLKNCTAFNQLCTPIRLILQTSFLPVSKVGAYCIISGRIRYTIGTTANSRHVFFARMGATTNTGFFMSSW